MFKSNNKFVLLVPGFLGHINEGVIYSLYHWFVNQGISCKCLDFPGNSTFEGELIPLSKMTEILIEKCRDLRKEYDDIVVISHSQGCGVHVRALLEGVDVQESIILTPALLMKDIINSRLSEYEQQLLKSGTGFLKDFGRDRIRYVTGKRYEELQSEEILSRLSENKKKLDNLRMSVYIGGMDPVINEELIDLFFNYFPSAERYSIEDADHVFSGSADMILKGLISDNHLSNIF